ncbi:MAG: peptidylprolyl isomerase [Anaerolineales bacterium]|nr:peptidylprolyl isomerase [Anaerolineales bacterium]
MPNEQGKKPVLHKKHVARLQREQQQSRVILYIFFGILAAVVLLLIYGWLDIKYFQAMRPVAKVGDTEILMKDFEPRVRLQRQQLLSQFNLFSQYAQFGMNVDAQLQEIQAQLDQPVTVGQTVLDQMVNEELIRQEAKKRGIALSEEEIQEAVEAAFEYFPNGTPTPTTTPTEVTLPEVPAEAFSIVTITPTPSATPEITSTPELTPTSEVVATAQTVEGTPAADVATLEPSPTSTATATVTAAPSTTPTVGPTSTPSPTATAYTLEGYEGQLSDATERLIKLGFDEKVIRKFFESQILERKLREAIAADVESVQTQVWARHILVADEQAAKDIIVRLQNGEDFATLAKELSTDTGSGANGGNLGWFGSGAMVAPFETAAFALENPGDITTEPVQSDFGYHIIQLIAKQERPLTAEQYDAAKQKAFADWLTAAKEEYGVETFDIWQSRVPNEPNFITVATEAANSQLTAQAEALEALEGTSTPKP